MTATTPPADHLPDPDARNLLPARIVAALMAFLMLALSQPARSAPPVPAPPPFPVGVLHAYPYLISGGIRPILVWSTDLPANADAGDHHFFIRQKQLSSWVEWDMEVTGDGEQLSTLPLDPAGSTFELWAVKTTSPHTNYLLGTTTIGTYLPTARVEIRTEDPLSALPRTRADRPIHVDITVSGLLSDPFAPASSTGVTLTRHAQSYGTAGTGDPLDRSLATLLSAATITTNATTTVTLPANAIPGENRAKVRGEERFTIFSRPDHETPESILASQIVQVWPVADASIRGIAPGQTIGASVPPVTFELNDLYPSSTTWAQVYQGAAQTGITGTPLPGSTVAIHGAVPVTRTLAVANYGRVIDADGLWTMELLTKTPFGTDRLAQVSFMVQRAGTTLAAWRLAHFNDATNSGDGADDNDFDKDGLANLIEFAFDLDPTRNSAGLLPVPERVGDELAIRFTPPAAITGVLHGAEWSTTLRPDSWVPVANTGVLPGHAFSVPVAGKPRLYLRLKATAMAP